MLLAQNLAEEAGMQLGLAELALLLEATGGDASRIAVEIEKLGCFAGTARKVTADGYRCTGPGCAGGTIFAWSPRWAGATGRALSKFWTRSHARASICRWR